VDLVVISHNDIAAVWQFTVPVALVKPRVKIPQALIGFEGQDKTSFLTIQKISGMNRLS